MARKKYFIDAATYQRIKSLDFSEMNDWLERFYRAAYTDGTNSVKVADAGDVVKEIAKVKGIGPKRIKAIEEAIENI